MATIVLHHYATSPFSEKIRAILGAKRLAWASVQIPTIMPKPDLVALTGGYRRTPVMQIGCDIYCDTKLMVRVLERLAPEPALLPPGQEAVASMIEQWADHTLFFLVVPVVMQPAGMAHFFAKLPPAALAQFQKDREALFASGRGRRASLAATRSELPPALATLESQLRATPYLLGAAPTLADFAVFHPLWFIFSNPGVAAYLDPYPGILAWTRRIAAFGHGEITRFSAADALRLARESAPQAFVGTAVDDPGGITTGERVQVGATDYGTETVEGTLAFSGLDELVVARNDERAGRVHVHFPRTGYRMERASA